MALVLDSLLTVGSRPVCSVCIANYNGESMLADCIDSVLLQDCGFSIEIIVHDDASTDGSLSLLRSHYPQVRIIASAANVGFCIGNNRMVAAARGEFVLLLNNDAALLPGALAAFAAEAARQSSPAILTLPQYDWESGALVDRGCMLDPFYNPVPNTDPGRDDVAYVIGACLWCPRTLWDFLGGFPEWIESIGEDLYLGCLARTDGFTVVALHQSGYRHRQGASFGGNRLAAGRLQTTYRRRRLSERNKTFVLLLFTPSPFATVLLALHLLVLMAEGAALSVLKRDPRLFREVYWNVPQALLSQGTRLLELRRRVQGRRRIGILDYFRVFTPIPRKITMFLRHGLPSLR